MFTVCPKCTLNLAVTAADLRAGQGYVRCGRCANVFNALLGLSEESLPAEGKPVEDPSPTAIPTDVAVATASRPIRELPEVTDDAIAQVPTAASSPPALRLIESPPRPLSAHRLLPEDAFEDGSGVTGNFETIVLEGDTILQTEELLPEEVLNSEIANVSRQIAAAHDTGEVIEITSGEFKLDSPPTANADMSLAEQPFRVIAPAKADRRLLGAGVLLSVVLIAQTLNHWRNDLATHEAWFGPFTHVAQWFGEPLEPNWNLSAYDVRQLGAAIDSADRHALRVRLSLTNTSDTQRLGMPLLRLTLLDRYGKALSRGELNPGQYLPAALQNQRFLLQQQRVDTEVSVIDRSQQASSFELDVCLRTAAQGLRCASDLPSVTGS